MPRASAASVVARMQKSLASPATTSAADSGSNSPRPVPTKLSGTVLSITASPGLVACSSSQPGVPGRSGSSPVPLLRTCTTSTPAARARSSRPETASVTAGASATGSGGSSMLRWRSIRSSIVVIPGI